MHRDLIHSLAAEVARVCPGLTWERVLPRPGEGLALLPHEAGAPALDLAPLAPRGWLAVTSTRLKADPAPGGSGRAALGRALTGRSLQGVALLAEDRIVRLDLDDGRSLVLEMLGAAGNMYLLDAGDLIVMTLRLVPRPGGRLETGDAWVPPAGQESGTRSEARWEPVSPDLPGRPGLGVKAPTRGMDPLDDVGEEALRLCLDGPHDGMAFEPSSHLGDAVLRRFWLKERHQRAVARLAAWRRRLRKEGTRLARLQSCLDQELERAAGHAAMRRQAECLAAALAGVRRQGQTILVPDLYGPPGAEVQLTLKPGEKPAEAMARLFRRAGRLQRGEARVSENLDRARRQRELVEGLAGTAAAITRLEDLDAAEKAAPAWLRKPVGGRSQVGPGRRDPRRPRDPRERKVRRYLLPGGWNLVVGGDAPVNDYVSFRLASPRDFWLHVADYPGAHVVVRNPGRLDDPPTTILHQAAAVAVWFSKAREKGPVQVRWTQARYLRKGKGLPVGTVLLPRSSTVTVEGAPPPRSEPGSHP